MRLAGLVVKGGVATKVVASVCCVLEFPLDLVKLPLQHRAHQHLVGRLARLQPDLQERVVDLPEDQVLRHGGKGLKKKSLWSK